MAGHREGGKILVLDATESTHSGSTLPLDFLLCRILNSLLLLNPVWMNNSVTCSQRLSQW